MVLQVLGDSIVSELCESTTVCNQRCTEAAPKVRSFQLELRGPVVCSGLGSNTRRLLSSWDQRSPKPSPHPGPKRDHEECRTAQLDNTNRLKKKKKSIQMKVPRTSRYSNKSELTRTELGSEKLQYSIHIIDAMQV